MLNNYCTDCNESLVLHAGGSIACSCNLLDADSTTIPSSWVLTQDELTAARQAEAEYSEEEPNDTGSSEPEEVF